MASLESLLDGTVATVAVASRKSGPAGFDPDAELKRQNAGARYQGRPLQGQRDASRVGESLVTHPRNRYFAQNFVNRLWAELMGRGIYEPIDDFSKYQDISHPKTLDFLRKEFVAVGYDLREMVRLVVHSDAYARGRLDSSFSDKIRLDSELAFVAGASRRMIGEALFDSMIIAGHLDKHKWPAGANIKTVKRRERVYLDENGEEKIAEATTGVTLLPAILRWLQWPPRGGYDLEKSIALDFESLLARNDVKAEELEAMRLQSERDLEAMRMAQMAKPTDTPRQIQVRLHGRQSGRQSLVFSSSYLMASPAPADHFLRIFGQPGRDRL